MNPEARIGCDVFPPVLVAPYGTKRMFRSEVIGLSITPLPVSKQTKCVKCVFPFIEGATLQNACDANACSLIQHLRVYSANGFQNSEGIKMLF